MTSRLPGPGLGTTRGRHPKRGNPRERLAPRITALAARFNCLSSDNRGLGLSQPLGARLSIEQMTDDELALTDDELALMDARGWPAAHVVGHSMGGLIALQVALLARERVRCLTFFVPGLPRCRSTNAADAEDLDPHLPRGSIPAAKRFSQHRHAKSRAQQLRPGALASELAPLFGHDLVHQPPIAVKQLMAMVGCDATRRLQELGRLATLVVSTTQDRVARPEVGRRITDAIPGARFVGIPDASHGVAMQHAERVNPLLLDHLGSAN